MPYTLNPKLYNYCKNEVGLGHPTLNPKPCKIAGNLEGKRPAYPGHGICRSSGEPGCAQFFAGLDIHMSYNLNTSNGVIQGIMLGSILRVLRGILGV